MTAGRFLSRAHTPLGCALLLSCTCNLVLHHPDAEHEILFRRVDFRLAHLANCSWLLCGVLRSNLQAGLSPKNTRFLTEAKACFPGRGVGGC